SLDLTLKKQLSVVQKIKTIDAHLENANKLPKYIPLLLQVKFDLEKIQSELIKYSTNLNHVGQLDKNYNRYIIEDIHTAIQIIDKYLSKEVVRKKYPKLQMVIRNDIKDYGNMFIDKTNKMTRNSLVNNEEYEGLLITPLVEKFKDSLKKRRLNTK
ncbi:DUF6038 family protein, partial [Staphylococcus aureus]|uniref:DUF6038 family protein n=1 Tax=Staphylococcus aureus TaxID=1280 RepID=UPI001F093FF2